MSVKEATRRGPLHDEWALRIKNRDHWKCWGCGMPVAQIKEAGGRLEAAHWLPHNEYPNKRYDMDNGHALCTFRNRRHPEGLGGGYGCHNAASGHWDGAVSKPVPLHRGRVSRLATFLLAAPLIVLTIFGDWWLRHHWAVATHFTFGSQHTFGGYWAITAGILASAVLIAHVALRRRWIWRSLCALGAGIKALAVLVGRGLRAGYRMGLPR